MVTAAGLGQRVNQTTTALDRETANQHSGTAAQRPNTDNSTDTSTDSTDLLHARIETRLATGRE